MEDVTLPRPYGLKAFLRKVCGNNEKKNSVLIDNGYDVGCLFRLWGKESLGTRKFGSKQNNCCGFNGGGYFRSRKSSRGFYLAEEPLPLENGEGGMGVGNSWKSKALLCQEFEELHGFSQAFPTKGPDKITSLPLYRQTFIPWQTAVTEELKADLEATAKEFLTLAGREDLVEAGLQPDSERYNDAANPGFLCDFENLSFMTTPGAITFTIEVPGFREAEEAELLTMIEENAFLSAACQFSGIDDPKVSYKQDHAYSGEPYSKIFSLYQNGLEGKELLKNQTFYSVSISAYYDSDQIVVRLTRPEIAEYMGDYQLLPYNKALNALRKEKGVQNKDVLGYEIKYTNMLSEGYYVPYYIFYYEDRDAAGVEPEEIESKDLHVFCEYYIRAVQDSQGILGTETEESPSSKKPERPSSGLESEEPASSLEPEESLARENEEIDAVESVAEEVAESTEKEAPTE